ncbi:MAG: hypothetical protein IID55_02730 [Proteobacteria bacterium]|nr:hypothetical protein [Planctomycetota bacterium]MCH8182077.1 hypothetical protein [Pseudomonadota bacterium]
MDWLERVKGLVRAITAIGLALIPLALLIQVLFGGFGGSATFFKEGILPNLMKLITELGEAGLVGLIALGIVIWLFRGLRAD